MKILHVINSLTSGGAEKLVSSLAKQQAESDQVGVFVFDSSNELFSLSGSNANYYTTTSNTYYSIKNIRFLFNLIKKYEVVHVHLFPSLYIVAILTFFFRKEKFFFTEHSTHNSRREKIYLRYFEKFIYSRYNKIICISNSVRNELEKWIGTGKNTTVIYNFIDFNEINSAKPYPKTDLGFQETDVLLIMIGSFNSSKDQKTLIDALRFLPDHFKLVLIGGGKLEPQVKKYVNDINLNQRVVFLGVRNDVYNILKACDYGIQSSHWEGFGIAALEYMASGLITLGTDVNGLNEIIPIKINLFEKGDYKNLANKIASYESKPEKKEYDLEVQNAAIKKYAIEKALLKHQTLYLK